MNKLNKKLDPKTAMTLSELLVATAVVGIILLGIISVDYALRSTRQNAARGSVLATKVATALTQMANDALLTTGDITNTGVNYDNPPAGNARHICFRYDKTDPNSYTDDRWACYEHSAADNKVNRCEELLNPIVTNCTGFSPRMIIELSQVEFYTVSTDVNNRIQYIEFTIKARDNPAYAVNPLSNPEYELTTRISPPSLSQ